MTTHTTIALRLPQMIGLNHIAPEVGDIEEARTFYRQLLNVRLRNKSDAAALIDLGDQFSRPDQRGARATLRHRHFGLVVDNRLAARALAKNPAKHCWTGRYSTFSIRRATAPKSSNTPASTSRKRPLF
jgi:hypothetical protein